MRLSVLALGVVLLLAGCHKSQPLHAQHAQHEPHDISWFDGSLEGAFTVAKRENRPVLLYWGAEWCPYCLTLKSTVFPRPDFIAKSHLFLPVYLDGDDEAAQRWAEKFGVQGYPTLIVLDPDQHEIIRVGAGRDISQYTSVLDLALDNLQPADVLLRSAAGGKSLNADECRRLAYNAWDLDELDPGSYSTRATQLRAAAQQCPDELKTERANLTIYAAYYAARAESRALDAAGSQPTAALSQLIDQVGSILQHQALAVSSAQALLSLDDDFFKAVNARGPAVASLVRDSYVEAMQTAAGDNRFALADQLGFLDGELHALKALNDSKYRFPTQLQTAIDMRIDAALSGEPNQYLRTGLLSASLDLLQDLGDFPKAREIAQAEIAHAGSTGSASAYYLEAELAGIAEKQGHPDEAVDLLEQAYRDAQGPSTRFQWGEAYVDGLLRLSPHDSQRIQEAGSSVIAELDGSDRIYRRTRVRLEKLDRELRGWNDAAKGQYADVLHELHGRMQQICVKIPDQDPARQSCDAFLKSA
ncbi:MAG TPA: thioredoxin family protein [Steroidobacteraceae bacterium]|nr:thioredoxin family protein [Steroidobacteraceae bacterium]